MKTLGVESLADYALTSSYTPGMASDEKFVEDVITPLLGATPPAAKKIQLRKLFLECYINFSADMQRKAQRPEDDEKPRTLAVPERAERLKQLKAQMVGLQISGELEPSHTVTDKFVDMKEKNQLRILEWCEITRRDQELRNIKKDEYWSTTVQGFMKRELATVEVAADLSSEARLRFTLQRRGLAMQLAKLCGFLAHEKIVNFLMKEYNRVPPPRYHGVTLEQVHTADQEKFILLIEKTEGGFELTPPGQYPLDKLIDEVIGDWRIKSLLTAMPMASATQGVKRDSAAAELAELKQEMKRLKAVKDRQPKGNSGNSNGGKGSGSKGSNGKGGGNSKKNDNRKNTPMPKGLQGYSASHNGKAICFACNMEGCKSKGPECKKGLHICVKCHGNHGLKQCREQ